MDAPNYKTYKQIPWCRLWINEELIILDENKNLAVLRTDGQKVELLLIEEACYYDKEWLWLCANHEIPPLIKPRHIRFLEKPFSKLRKEYQPIYTYRYYFDKEKKYRLVAGYPQIAVSRNGEIVDIRTAEKIPTCTNNHGYLGVRTYSSMANRYRIITVHRLVALAWVSGWSDKNIVVNHLDGNKLNPDASNLEWTTQAENVRHAVRTGLMNTKACKIRNITTGEITKFVSLSLLNKFLQQEYPGHTPLVFISSRLNKVRLLYGLYEFRLENDEEPWFYINTIDKPTIYVNPGCPSYATFTIDENDKIIVINGTAQLIDRYKLFWCRKTVENLMDVFRSKYPQYSITANFTEIIRSIEIRNLTTNEEKIYENVRLASRTAHISVDKLTSLLRYDGSVYRHTSDGDIQIRYVPDTKTPWPIDPVLYAPRKLLTIHDRLTKTDRTFSSFREAARSLDVNRQLLSRMATKPYKTDRYQITQQLYE